MNIEFAHGEAGYHEARVLDRLVHEARQRDPADSAEVQLLDSLAVACSAQIGRPEFAALRKVSPADDVPPADGGWWRMLFGPSRREQLLSAQRIAALERAARAEGSAFEALAETARVARERDEALARLATLEAGRAADET